MIKSVPNVCNFIKMASYLHYIETRISGIFRSISQKDCYLNTLRNFAVWIVNWHAIVRISHAWTLHVEDVEKKIVIRVKLYTDFTYLERPRTFVNPLFSNKCFLKVQNFVYITLYSRLKRTSDRYLSWQGRHLCLWSVLEKCIPVTKLCCDSWTN